MTGISAVRGSATEVWGRRAPSWCTAIPDRHRPTAQSQVSGR
jgi:hypothetical protein